jgi:biotin carboxyl carrier protein
MNFKKSVMLLLAMGVLLCFAAGSALRADDSAAKTVPPCPKKVAVTVETVQSGTFMEYQYFSGVGHAEIVPVKSPVDGVLSEVKVSEGSLVDADQELAVLNAGMDEEVKKLEAAAASAKKILTARQGWKVKSEKAIQAAEKEYQKALDLLNAAKAKANLTVKAPVAGIVHLVMAAGAPVSVDAVLLEIANPKQMIFQVPLAAADRGTLAVGDRFIGTSEGLSGEAAAEVAAVGDDQITFRVNNDANQYREGVAFTFKKLKAEHADAIIIPSSAVQKDSLGDFIYIVEKKRAKKIYVTVAASGEGKTMVEKGLVAGTALIVSDLECLVDGKKVRVVNAAELAKEKAAAKAKEKPAVQPEVKPEEAPAAEEKPAAAREKRFRAGLVFGRFSINDKNMRSFYGDWFKNIPGIEASFHVKYNIDVWASYKIFSESQTTTYYQNPVKFKLTPLAVGLRYRFPMWRFVEPFAGAGLNFYSYKETISGETTLENTKGSATGFHLDGGAYFHIKKFPFLLGEVFLKYNIVKKTLAELLPDGTDKLDLGGLELGVGLVATF